MGNPVQVTTSAKMSQTWLASHTGPIDSAMRLRCAAPAVAEPGEKVPESSAEIGAGQEHVRGDAAPQKDENDVGEQASVHAFARPIRRSTSSVVAVNPE